MFTGIIKHIAIVEKNQTLGDGSAVLQIKFNHENNQGQTIAQNWHFFDSTKIGDSVAINGICLTVVKIDNNLRTMEFFVSRETISNTTILMQAKGTKINAELAMLASDRLGGHIVSGHVDEVIKLKSINPLGESFVLEFEASLKNSAFLIKKGSITIDGVSLTINKVFRNTFEVCIIPHTWQNTTLNRLDAISNNLCNVEYDYFAKIINKNLVQMLKYNKNIAFVGENKNENDSKFHNQNNQSSRYYTNYDNKK